jgi:hypothetical protein
MGPDSAVVTPPFFERQTPRISDANNVSFRNSSRGRPLKLSMNAFCTGLLGFDAVPLDPMSAAHDSVEPQDVVLGQAESCDGCHITDASCGLCQL